MSYNIDFYNIIFYVNPNMYSVLNVRYVTL